MFILINKTAVRVKFLTQCPEYEKIMNGHLCSYAYTFPVPRDLPQDPVDLASLALRHMEPDLSARVTTYQVVTPGHTLSHLPRARPPSGTGVILEDRL